MSLMFLWFLHALCTMPGAIFKEVLCVEHSSKINLILNDASMDEAKHAQNDWSK